MWQKGNTWSIGGVREIGFKSNTDLLMVLSSQGRGIFDCMKDKKIGRDHFDYYMEKWDSDLGIVEGFGFHDALRRLVYIGGGIDKYRCVARPYPDSGVGR